MRRVRRAASSGATSTVPSAPAAVVLGPTPVGLSRVAPFRPPRGPLRPRQAPEMSRPGRMAAASCASPPARSSPEQPPVCRYRTWIPIHRSGTSAQAGVAGRLLPARHDHLLAQAAAPSGHVPAVSTRARAKSALRGLTCGYGGQQPRTSFLSRRYVLHLQGEHSTRAQVRATRRRPLDATARSRHRIAVSLRQHPTRSTACLTTLHEPCSASAPSPPPHSY